MISADLYLIRMGEGSLMFLGFQPVRRSGMREYILLGLLESKVVRVSERHWLSRSKYGIFYINRPKEY